jgi:hypothetical protein
LTSTWAKKKKNGKKKNEIEIVFFEELSESQFSQIVLFRGNTKISLKSVF